MSGEVFKMKNEDYIFKGIVNRDFKFYVGGKERLKITPEGFYVDGRLVENDAEVYEAFKAFLAGCVNKETQDDRYYKAIKRFIKKEGE